MAARTERTASAGGSSAWLSGAAPAWSGTEETNRHSGLIALQGSSRWVDGQLRSLVPGVRSPESDSSSRQSAASGTPTGPCSTTEGSSRIGRRMGFGSLVAAPQWPD